MLLVLAGAAIFCLYFFGLTRTGLLSADEPRYASIGRDMARSGDWITPRLWGQPWFEKPALLYWMTASAYVLHLPDDWAPRLPVALASAGFLLFFWIVLRREYDERAAWYATLILATSAGWIAFSHIAVTDIPLSVCLGVSMLLVLTGRNPIVAGVFLGLAVLAKGLVPFVLFLPAMWYLRPRLRQAALIVAVSLIVAAPWYALVTLRNGMPFIDEFFIKHHFARFATGSLQHVRPAWFFVPVLLGSVFPWTPLVWTLFRRDLYAGRREWFLLAWLGFGFVFFSASCNKLPSYLLPLLPPLAALLALGLARVKRAPWMLSITGASLWLIPVIAGILPQALQTGLSRTPLRASYGFLIPAALLAAAIWRLESHGHRDRVMTVIGILIVASVVGIVWNTYPVLDRTVSARMYWRTHPNPCVDNQNRSWRYGLNYYAEKLVRDCNHLP